MSKNQTNVSDVEKEVIFGIRTLNGWPARRWLLLALIGMVVLYGSAIWNNQSAVLSDGRRAFWLHDDMMISMRYARNLTNGYGLVWNPGQEPVEGYSNFGWLVVMAVVHLLPLPDTQTSLIMLAINGILAALVLVLTTKLAQRLVPRPGIWLLGALISLVVVVDLGRWTTIGLEVPLQTAVFLWLLIRVLDEAAENRPRLLTFFLAGLLGLIRVDGPLLAGIVCLVAFRLQTEKRRVLFYTPLILVLPLAHILFRLIYYGYPLPNTYYLKLVAWDDRLLAGFEYFLNFLGLYFPMIGLAMMGAVLAKDRRHWLLLFAGLPLVLYAIYTGGDDFGGSRFFAPWLPVLLLLAFSAPAYFDWQDRPLRVVLLLGVLTAYLTFAGGYDFFQGPGQEAVLAEGGLALGEMTSTDASIGVFWAGTLPYFAHRPAVDMLGKNDAFIARQPANEGSLKPGHNKFDYDYSLAQQRPDLLISSLSLSVVATPNLFMFYTEGNDAYSGQLFLDDTFQAAYAPTLLMIDLVPVFIRSDSPERVRLLAKADCDAVTDEELVRFGLDMKCAISR